MQFNTPMLVAGLGVGALAAYAIFRKPLADRAFYAEYAEDPDFAEFEPSEWSFSEDEFADEDDSYGFWWATKRGKARRRDRKRRRASRRAGRYNKCVEKKGADHKSCLLIQKYMTKSLERADALDAKLVAKGQEPTAYTAPVVASVMQTAYEPGSSSQYEQAEMELVGPVSDIPQQSSGGISPMVLALGGVAVIGLGGTAIFVLAKPKKKRRRRRKKAPAVAAA